MTDYNLGRVVGTDGTGIQAINTTLEASGRRLVEIVLTTGTTERFYIEKGAKGDTGTGIRTIELISTVGKDKNYRITFTDNSTFDYTISDGEDAVCDADFDIESENAVQNKVITGAIDTINTAIDEKYDEKEILQLLHDYGYASDSPVTRITLESDKDILSYADGDTATLTATAYDTNDNGVANQIVVFYKDGKVLDTGVTDSNGEATYEYESAGVGDIVFGASVGSLFIETYEIEDCTDYQIMTDNSKESRWSIPSAVSSSSIFGYSSDGWKFGNASSYSTITYYDAVNRPFSLECTVTDSNGLQPIIGAMFGSSYIFFTKENNQLIVNVNGSQTRYNVNFPSSYDFKYELTDNTVKVYIDNVLIATANHSLTGDCVPALQTSNNRYTVIKDFKLKLL